MSNKVTPEACYAEWHRQIQLSRGVRARAMKNFAKAQAKDTWIYFERFAQLCNKNAGQMDYKLFLSALVEHFKGYVPPKEIPTMKSIKIYKSYVKLLNLQNDPVKVKQSILSSLKFVINFMRENDMHVLNDYLMDNHNIIPSVLKHYNAGSISIHFLCCVPNFNTMIASYPTDVVDEYITNFDEDYRKYRSRLVSTDDKVVQSIINNLEVLLKRALENPKSS
jgi:hypothetical protein